MICWIHFAGNSPYSTSLQTAQKRTGQDNTISSILAQFWQHRPFFIKKSSTLLVPIPFPLIWEFLIVGKSSHLEVSSEPPLTSDIVSILQKNPSGETKSEPSPLQPYNQLVYNNCKDLTCFSFVPTMEALLSSTNTTFFGNGGRSVGAK